MTVWSKRLRKNGTKIYDNLSSIVIKRWNYFLKKFHDNNNTFVMWDISVVPTKTLIKIMLVQKHNDKIIRINV